MFAAQREAIRTGVLPLARQKARVCDECVRVVCQGTSVIVLEAVPLAGCFGWEVGRLTLRSAWTRFGCWNRNGWMMLPSLLRSSRRRPAMMVTLHLDENLSLAHAPFSMSKARHSRRSRHTAGRLVKRWSWNSRPTCQQNCWRRTWEARTMSDAQGELF